MKRYSLTVVAEATGYGREALALYVRANGRNPAHGMDLSQVIEFLKAMRRKNGCRHDPAEVKELRDLLRAAGLEK